ncbi:hypothetical protein V0U79_00365 [Hyphobacterium sp. HN65]|uniref:FlgO domain-containing protein n=1 Tax=Hyphobacterium lacteum TaxID=3116575 RepID=A0ABU7LN93_9PROT|nr:hypothetical protein [Hyphobacterium sp. HN65]MEE2524804.1 hypothetical protein [Hyphobacterium sp. HN65]
MSNLISELQRRNVFRVAAAYLVVGWIVMQVVDVIGSAAGIPPWANAFALIVLIVAFPVIIFIAWAFELTPDGMKRTADVPMEESRTGQTGSVLNIAIIAGLAIVVVLLVWQQFSPTADQPPAVVDTAQASDDDEGNDDLIDAVAPPERSVAVLPFLSFSSNEDDRYFADGLTEEILNSLAYVPELIVTSRTSAFQFRGDDLPSIPEIAERLGVAHILEGSIRPSRNGEQVRITAQLIRAADDAHLWSQTYDRSYEDVFAVQEDIAENIAAVLGVALDAEARERMDDAGTNSLEAFIAFQRGYALHSAAHDGNGAIVGELEEANAFLMEAVSYDPDFSEAYNIAADLYAHRMLEILRLEPEIDEQQFEAARQSYFDLLDQAAANTQDASTRALVALDRLYFSDNWIGVSEQLDNVDPQQGCGRGAWLPEFVAISGRAEEFLPYYRRWVQCDPLNPLAWSVLNRIAFAAGDFELSAEAARRDLELNPDGNLGRYSLVAAVAASGDRETTLRLLREFSAPAGFVSTFEAILAGGEGDAGPARALIESEAEGNSQEGFRGLGQFTLLAIVDDRERLNALVADVDQRPLGYYQIIRVLIDCRCGVPFDMEAAPNFARRIEQAGIDWPPPGEGRFSDAD